MKIQKPSLLIIALLLIFLSGCMSAPIVATIPPPTTVPQPTNVPQPTASIDRVATSVSSTQTAIAEMTSVAATLTALAPKPTSTPTRLPTLAIIIPPSPTTSPYAMVINHHTQLCLIIQGRDIVQASCRGIDNQLWQNKSGYDPRQFMTKSGACLSFSGIDIVVSGAGCPIWTVRQWGDYLSIKAQNNPHPGPPHPNPTVLQYGIYFQIIDGGNCVDVDGWNHDEGGKLIYWPCSGSLKDNANQLWSYYQR